MSPTDAEAAAHEGAGIFGFDVSPEEAAVVLLPVPFDATTSFGQGTCDGPEAILRASHQIDFWDPVIGPAYERGICLLPEEARVRQRNLEARAAVFALRTSEDAERRRQLVAAADIEGAAVNDTVSGEVSGWLDAGKIVGTVGGDHATAYGSITAHLQAFPAMGILHIDAHADLRQAYEGLRWSHASVMGNVINDTDLHRLVQVGLRDVAQSEVETIHASDGRVLAFFDRELGSAALEGTPFSTLVARIVEALPAEVYISFDIDGLDPTLCPNTGTPVPGGLSFHQARALIEGLTASGRRLVGFDLVEVAPAADGSGIDANVGARLLYLLCGHALLGRQEATSP